MDGSLVAGRGIVGAHLRLSFANHLAGGQIQQTELERVGVEVTADRKRSMGMVVDRLLVGGKGREVVFFNYL